MSWTRPGRLHRTLRRIGIPTPLVTVTGNNFTVSDTDVTSLSMTHGGTDPSPGIQPSTCEAVIQRPAWIKTGQDFTVSLTAAAAAALAARTTIPANRFTERFTGRVGSQVNTDTPKGLSARLKAASWSAQLSRVDVEPWLGAGTAVNDAIRFLCTSPALPEIDFWNFGTFDELHESIPDATYSNTMASVSSDIGVLVRDTRAGRLEAWPLEHRMQQAADQIGTQYPLTRSQALSPATWEQPNEDMPAKVRADWIAADGTPYAISSGGTPESIVERHDWTHIRARTGSLNLRFRALVNQAWDRIFRLPSVKVDLLYLLASNNPYHRGQAGMLLSLNAGDTIGLSGDWYSNLQGLHVVTGIDEQITGSAWTLTLSLAPHKLVFGEESPPVPALVWESATYPWRDEPRTWNL